MQLENKLQIIKCKYKFFEEKEKTTSPTIRNDEFEYAIWNYEFQ